MLLDLLSVEYPSGDTHDGASVDNYLKRRKRERAALQALEDEKLAYAKQLKEQIKRALRPITEEIEAIEEAKPLPITPAKIIRDERKLLALQEKLAGVEFEITLLHDKMLEEARRWREDDDIQVILLTIH